MPRAVANGGWKSARNPKTRVTVRAQGRRWNRPQATQKAPAATSKKIPPITCNTKGPSVRAMLSPMGMNRWATLPRTSMPTAGISQRQPTMIQRVARIIVGCLWLIPAVGMLVLGSVAHLFIPMGESMARTLGPFVLHVMAGIFLLVAAGAFCVAWGLFPRRPWAGSVTLVLAFLGVFHPPFATALGIDTLWVLLPAS